MLIVSIALSVNDNGTMKIVFKSIAMKCCNCMNTGLSICILDWKAMSHADRYGNIGTHILICTSFTYQYNYVMCSDTTIISNYMRNSMSDSLIIRRSFVAACQRERICEIAGTNGL